MPEPMPTPSADAPGRSQRELTQPVADPRATSDDRPAAGGGRYELLEEIAGGGMGVIYRATDTALGREVAVKVLQEKFAPDSGTARRFADEARIAAQLQHPGIPPVHDLGSLPDGRPFLAMKLIKGRTLEELLAARPDLAADRGRFVAAFEAACQAVAYAHAHGVIHRDLKPANVMVGAFGEVQVMDWGLAKVLAGAEADADDPEETRAGTLVVSLRDSDGSFTQAGSVLGTPAYMPPEQALGAVHEIDCRSDVFGLGSILAVILTGRSPFVAETAETTRVMAARGLVNDCFARLDASQAEPDLVALCKKCLAPERGERPADAGAVAEAVIQLRAAADERARQAEIDRARTEARAAEQLKRRRTTNRATAVVAVVLLVGFLAIMAALVRAEAALREANQAHAEAEASLNRAQQNLSTARSAVRLAFHKIAGVTLADVPEAGPLRFELGDLARQYIENFLRAEPDNPDVRWDAVDIYRTLGRLEGNAGHAEKSAEYYDRSLAVGRGLVADSWKALDGKGFHLTEDGRLIISVKHPAPAISQFAHEYHMFHARTCTEAGMARRNRGRFTDARRLYEEAAGPLGLARLRAACPELIAFRRLDAVLGLELARLDLDEGRDEEALRRYGALAAEFRGWVDKTDPRVALQSVPAYQKNSELSHPEGDPANLGRALRGQGVALARAGRTAPADEALSEGVRRLDKATKTEERNVLGALLTARGVLRSADPAHRADATADLDRAVAVLGQCYREHGEYHNAGRGWAAALVARGRLRAAGPEPDRAGAAADFRAARDAAEKVIAAGDRPPSVDDQYNAAAARAGLAGLAAAEGDATKAGTLSAEAARLCQEALELCPTHYDCRTLLKEVQAKDLVP